MNFENCKNLAGTGASLLFVGVLPFANSFFLLPILGLILMLLGLKGLSEYYTHEGIFNNFLYGVIVAIVGVAVVASIAFIVFLGIISVIVPGWNGDWTTLITTLGSVEANLNLVTEDLLPYIGLLLLDWVVLFVFTLIFCLLFRKSASQLFTKSRIGLFASTGTVLLVGGVLSIILIGFVIIWIGILMFAISVFRTKKPVSQQLT
jgi:uncharacterized membrane protein